MSQEAPIIGIDLGTTNSVVAVLEAGEPKVIFNGEGSNKTPSVVAFLDGGRVVVGEIAKRQAATNPERTIASIKRLMGRYYSEVVQSPEAAMFDMRTDDQDRVLIHIDGVGYTPQQISAIILQSLKDAAQEYLGQTVTQAIVTVPAYFDDLQRTATLEAGRIAGLEILRLINEPTAAAMAYGLGREGEETVAVYDFGGGTFDISILDIDNKTFEVLNSAGDSYLGGDDIDELLVEHLLNFFEERNGFALETDPMILRRLREAAEKAKCELSTLRQTHVSLPFIGRQGETPLHLEADISRDDFEEMVEPLVQRTLDICRKALEDSNMSRRDLKKVILVGGTTRIPLVQEMVEDFFGLEPHRGVNPDEIVALGAAAQGGVLRGQLQEVVLLDVTPHSLGVEVKENRRSLVIEKNATIPIKSAKTFTTTENQQTFVTIHVLQGESEIANENRSLGKFTLSDIAPAQAGAPRIRVTFFINADGVVEISAADLQTGQEKTLTITHSFLNEDERRGRGGSTKRRARRPRRIRKEKGEEPRVVGVPLEPSRVGTGKGDSSSVRKTQAPALHDFAVVSAEDELPHSDNRTHGDVSVAIGGGPAQVPFPSPPGSSVRRPAAARGAPSQQFATPTRAVPGRSRPGPSITPRPAAKSMPKPKSAPAPEGPGADWPEAMREAMTLLETRREDEEARQSLLASASEFRQHIFRQPGDLAARLSLARLYLACQMAEECRGVLSDLVAARPESVEWAYEIYGALVEKYPNYIQARKDRSESAIRLERYDEAVQDLEGLQDRDETALEATERLAEIYEIQLSGATNPAIQFKLVKACLKLKRLDQAVEILQGLVGIPTYETRATRILGLCYWQKNQLDKAWEAFQGLKTDQNLKDILYRLGSDLEAADRLTQAHEVFQRLSNEDPSYRDASGRSKKLAFRLRLRREQTQRDQTSDRFDIHDSRFTIVEEINRGSMGIVFKARDRVLDEIVALKVLNDSLVADPEAVERFKQEARAAKRLSHPHIVRIHDMFESGRKRFLSMEYIDGQDLKRMLAEPTRIAEKRFLGYLRQTLEALEYAHGLGVVHRDIKPANLMITKEDTIKITDFGIAKILTSLDATKTGTMIVGTPLYMSPEQIEGRRVDARSDIYSLGIMVFEYFAGAPPFYEGNIEYHHVHSIPPDLPDTVPPRMSLFIQRCIEKNPDDRYQSSREALDFLVMAAS